MKEYRKAILAFLGLLATNVAADVMGGGNEWWPATIGEGVRWAVTMLAGTWLVYRIPNAPQFQQVDGYLGDHGMKAVPTDKVLPPATPGDLP
jgi:hypothetical protein